MTGRAEDAAWRGILTSPRIGRIIVALCLIVILLTALQYGLPQAQDRPYVMKDYDAFYIAGRLYWDGHLTDAYGAKTLVAAQQRILHTSSFMPWTYPPHYNLLTAGLALLPVWLGYGLFMLASFAAYIAALRRLAGAHSVAVLIAVFPAVAVCLRTGQNGMLTGALFGLFACWFLRGNRLAAVPLGLLTYKPHLLLGMGLLLILGRAWQVILLSAAITLALLAVATALFGMGIWPAFLSSVAEAGDFLSAGIYPMFRMTSVYATVQSLGFPVWAASVAQAAVAIGAIGVLLLVHRRRLPRRQALGIGMLTTVFFSPYAYDYDLSVLGVALALLLPDTVARATGRALFVMVALLWVACGAGITLALLAPALHLGREHLPSLGAVALVPFCLLVLRIQFGMRESGH